MLNDRKISYIYYKKVFISYKLYNTFIMYIYNNQDYFRKLEYKKGISDKKVKDYFKKLIFILINN